MFGWYPPRWQTGVAKEDTNKFVTAPLTGCNLTDNISQVKSKYNIQKNLVLKKTAFPYLILTKRGRYSDGIFLFSLFLLYTKVKCFIDTKRANAIRYLYA